VKIKSTGIMIVLVSLLVLSGCQKSNKVEKTATTSIQESSSVVQKPEILKTKIPTLL